MSIGHCLFCNKKFEKKGRKLYCDDSCGIKYRRKVKNGGVDTDNGEYVECSICGAKKASLTYHLSKLHNITMQEYMIQYNKTLDECILKSTRKFWGDKLKGDKNGAYQHDGKYSPYSKKFIKYDKLSDADKEKKINNVCETLSSTLTDGSGRMNTQVGYWTKQGYTEIEAKKRITERQTTFSLEKCIEKYGKNVGKERWKERQSKWLSSLPKQNFSFISQKLFWSLYDKVKNEYNMIYFAQLNQQTKQLEENKNYEYKLDIGQSYCKLDFFIKDINKAIEFDGDYWHGEKRGNKKRDETRTRLIEETGVKVLHVKERDYNNDQQKVLQECIKFIYDR
jgi:very-short-patch-repair endonuclease